MGQTSSDDGGKRYSMDHCICSYSPSLSALIQSHNRGFSSRSPDNPPLRLVAQPEPSLLSVGGEIRTVETLNTEMTSPISANVTPAAVIDRFRHYRFIRVACHGTAEARIPFDARFEFYRDGRLLLLEIVRSHLPTA